MYSTFTCTALALLLLLTPQAEKGATIRIWKVGSPHTGDTPDSKVPASLARDVASRGWRLSIDAFPPQGFADRFFAAVRDGTAPDVLVFDNFGILKGITTGLGSFVGIGQDPVVRNQLVQVTRSFDELLGPARGWTFLFTRSENYDAARELALRTPRCASPSSAGSLPADLVDIIPKIARAYLAGDSTGIVSHADPEGLLGRSRNLEPVNVGSVAVCGGWGNERLAFVTVTASYQADTAIGHASLLLAFRKTSSLWQLLVAARDPVSNGDFVAQLPGLANVLTRNLPAGPLPAPAVLRSPQNGRFPVAPTAERFGNFEWQSSSSEDVVAEIAEFSYQDDARLFLLRPLKPAVPRRVSAGQLWSTQGDWAWRVWSISRSGEIAFSEQRTFVH